MAVKQLIVGWNRGGLGYVHQLLHKAECDVGLTFGYNTTLEELLDKLPTASQFEVSPYVVPFLGHQALKDIEVAFVIRDPMRVLNSLYFHGLFHNEKWSAVQHSAFTHLPNFATAYKGKPAQAGCAYLHNWLKMAKEHRPTMQRVRIEDGPEAVLKALAGPKLTVPFVTPTVNASFCKQTIIPSELPHKSRWGITNMLLQLGYREWAWMPRGGHAHYVNPDWHC